METGRNPSAEPDLPDLMTRVARGDQDAFASLYDVVAGPVLGIVRKVLRDGLIRLRDCLGARRDPGGSATLTGAYALHALADDERECFERHAADCADCTREVRELSATAARLGLAVTASPGPALKDQVMRRITTVRQEPPRALPLTAPRAPGIRRRRPGRWALAAAASLDGTAVWQHERAQDTQEQARQAERRAEQVTAVLTAPDARSRTAKPAGGASGTVVVSRSRDRAVFISSKTAKPPGGKVYRLWFDDGGPCGPPG